MPRPWSAGCCRRVGERDGGFATRSHRESTIGIQEAGGIHENQTRTSLARDEQWDTADRATAHRARFGKEARARRRAPEAEQHGARWTGDEVRVLAIAASASA